MHLSGICIVLRTVIALWLGGGLTKPISFLQTGKGLDQTLTAVITIICLEEHDFWQYIFEIKGLSTI